MNKHPLVGQKYNFPDGNVIEVIQVNDREVNGENSPWVTYLIYQHSNLPRKLLMKYSEFVDNFGHLFNIITDK